MQCTACTCAVQPLGQVAGRRRHTRAYRLRGGCAAALLGMCADVLAAQTSGGQRCSVPTRCGQCTSCAGGPAGPALSSAAASQQGELAVAQTSRLPADDWPAVRKTGDAAPACFERVAAGCHACTWHAMACRPLSDFSLAIWSIPALGSLASPAGNLSVCATPGTPAVAQVSMTALKTRAVGPARRRPAPYTPGVGLQLGKPMAQVRSAGKEGRELGAGERQTSKSSGTRL